MLYTPSSMSLMSFNVSTWPDNEQRCIPYKGYGTNIQSWRSLNAVVVLALVKRQMLLLLKIISIRFETGYILLYELWLWNIGRGTQPNLERNRKIFISSLFGIDIHSIWCIRKLTKLFVQLPNRFRSKVTVVSSQHIFLPSKARWYEVM